MSDTADGSTPSSGYLGRAWLGPAVVGAAVLAVMSGYGQFGVTTVLGDVAEAFGETTAGTTEGRPVGLSATTLGIGLAAIRLAGLGSLPVASLADRHGRRIVLWTAGIGLGLTVIAAGMPSYWTFVAIVALARPLLAGTNVVATVVAAEATRTAERARALAVAEVGYALGSGLVVVVHGLGSSALGFRGVLGLAAVLFLAFPWLIPRLQESQLFERLTRRDDTDADVPVAHERLGRVSPSSRRRLLIVCALAGSLGLITGPAFTFVFLYGENVLELTPVFMTVVVLVGGALGLPGLLVGRWAADRFGRRITAASAMTLTAVSAWVTYADGATALAIGYVGALVAAAMIGPAGGALFTEVFPTRDRSTATGWASAAGVLGAVAGLALFGLLIDALGGFARAGATLWLPLIPLAGGYALLPETRHTELEELDRPNDDPGDLPA